MKDKVLEGFLRRQFEEGMALEGNSDLLCLVPLGGSPPARYLAQYRCKGLVRDSAGQVGVEDRFDVGIWFPMDYLRRVDPYQVLTWLLPRNVFHPNVRFPVICVGRLAPGTPLLDMLYQVFELITCHKVTMREDDALNRDACMWARHNQHRFPIDRRPLKRRNLELRVKLEKKASQP